MTLQIVCQNCGAKYKLPPTFTADKAKCKACGSAIDVAAQRESDAPTAAAAPAAAKPAAARPARARGGEEAAPRRPRAAGSSSGSRRARGGDDAEDGGSARGGRRSGARGGARRGRGGDDDGGDDKPRRGRAAAEKKAGNPALLWGGIGLAAAAIVVLIFVFGSGDDPDPNAGADDGAVASAGPEAADGGAEPGESADTTGQGADSGDAPAGSDDGAVADGGSDTGSGDGGTAGGDGGAGAAAATDPDPEEKPAESTPKPEPAAKTDQPKSPDEVFDPKTETQPVRWPDDVSAEERQQAESDVALIVEEGTGWRIDKAKTRLLESPYPTVLAITEALRHFDYFDADQARTAYSLHELLRQIHDDKLNPGYRVPEAGVAREDMNIENVEFNAKCVKPWVRLIESKYTSREAFTAYLAQLKKQKKDD